MDGENPARSGAGLLVHTLDAVADGSAHAEPQPTEGVTYAPKLTVDDARVNWDVSAVSINRLIRACEPAPGAWTTHGQTRVKLLGSEVVQAADLNPGHVRVDKNSVIVGCGISALRLVNVQPQGKRVMSAGDWIRGLRDIRGLAFLCSPRPWLAKDPARIVAFDVLLAVERDGAYANLELSQRLRSKGLNPAMWYLRPNWCMGRYADRAHMTP